MIEKCGIVSYSTVVALRAMLLDAPWEVTDTEERRYSVWLPDLAQLEAAGSELTPVNELTLLWPRERWYRAMFLAVPPGGYVHKHRDGDDVYVSYHVPVVTNARCETFEHDGDETRAYHLETGSVYRFDRTRVHSSVNRGATERVHLIMEITK